MGDRWDVAVVGGGHAGVEAFAAAARIGARVVLVVPDWSELGVQPCNPAVGGPGKGHLVREVVALGGVMGAAADASGIQFRTLNASKGAAVRATRVQTDSRAYVAAVQRLVRGICDRWENAAVLVGRARSLVWRSEGARRRVHGLRLEDGTLVESRTVVVATGTFLRGRLFIGDEEMAGGRMGAPATVALSDSLRALGLPLLRLKTGTCPRLDGGTIDTSALERQEGDVPPPFFDPDTREPALPQRACYVTWTTARTHALIGDNLTRSAMYSGRIVGIGPRYCPSIETKIERFPDKDRHQIFLEPEDVDQKVVYPAGLSTSLPKDVQVRMIHSIPGLERARIVRWGYAVEYDAVAPQALSRTLECRDVPGLYLAGQILGTSGYEEAAALGLWAGANAALAARGREPFVLRRDQAYMGVMVDDLTGRGVDEPYRMFTSRAEYRLLLREDNAQERLLAPAEAAGLLPPERLEAARSEVAAIRAVRRRLDAERVTPSAAIRDVLAAHQISPFSGAVSLAELLRRCDFDWRVLEAVAPWVGAVDGSVRDRVAVDVKYAGYVARQRRQAARLREIDTVEIPDDLSVEAASGLRAEIVEKLRKHQPSTLGQFARIPGVTPAAVEILRVCIERHRRHQAAGTPS